MNPAQLLELQDPPGFTPVIINIQPMINLQIFLGLNKDDAAIEKIGMRYRLQCLEYKPSFLIT